MVIFLDSGIFQIPRKDRSLELCLSQSGTAGQDEEVGVLDVCVYECMALCLPQKGPLWVEELGVKYASHRDSRKGRVKLHASNMTFHAISCF